MLFSNIPRSTENITAEGFLSAFKAPVEIFQEGYRAFTRQRSELCPRGSFKHPSMSSSLGAEEVSQSRWPSWRSPLCSRTPSTARCTEYLHNTCTLSAQRTTSFSLKPRGSLDKCSCSRAHASVPGHVHREMEMCLQHSLLSSGGGSRSQLPTSLRSGCAGSL